MGRVLVRRIALEGFGAFAQPISAELRTDLNVWVAPNETGKSSLLEGLCAIFYGLPGRTDPDVWGAGRFRRLDISERFQGELELEVDGRLFRWQRQFDTNLLRIEEKVQQGWLELFAGQHNPLARQGSAEVEELLSRLWCPLSLSGFRQVFFVDQFPSDRLAIDSEIRHLLAGSGTDFDQVLARLEDQIKERTQHIGEVIADRNPLRKKRRLEILEETIEDHKRQIEQSRNLVAALQGNAQSINNVNQQLAVTEEEIAAKRNLLTLLEQWWQTDQRYQDCCREQEKLAQVYRRIDHLETSMDTYGSKHNFPEDFPERLHRLEQQRADQKRVVAELAELANQKTQLLQQAADQKHRFLLWRLFGTAIVGCLVALVFLSSWYLGAAVVVLFWTASSMVVRKCQTQIAARLARMRAKEEQHRALLTCLREQAAAQARELLGVDVDQADLDLEKVWQNWRSWQESREKLRQLSTEREALLKSSGFASVQELRAHQLSRDNEAAALWLRRQTLLEEHAQLADFLERNAEHSPLAIRRQLAEEITMLEEKYKELRHELYRLREEEAVLTGRGAVNISRLEEELQLLAREKEQLELEIEALGLAYHQLNQIINEFQEGYQDHFAASISRYFQKLSGVESRFVSFGDEFDLQVMHQGRRLALSQLSRGGRDQLFLAVRLAIADFLAGWRTMPLIFDDPFVTFDQARLENLREALVSESTRRQIILVSHQQAFADWGKSITINDNNTKGRSSN